MSKIHLSSRITINISSSSSLSIYSIVTFFWVLKLRSSYLCSSEIYLSAANKVEFLLPIIYLSCVFILVMLIVLYFDRVENKKRKVEKREERRGEESKNCRMSTSINNMSTFEEINER